MIFIRSNRSKIVTPIGAAIYGLINLAGVKSRIGNLFTISQKQYFSVKSISKKFAFGNNLEYHAIINIEYDDVAEDIIEVHPEHSYGVPYKYIQVMVPNHMKDYEWMGRFIQYFTQEIVELQAEVEDGPIASPFQAPIELYQKKNTQEKSSKSTSNKALKSVPIETRPARASSFTGEIDERLLEDSAETVQREEYLKVDYFEEMVHYGGWIFNQGVNQFVERAEYIYSITELDAVSIQLYPQIVQDFYKVYQETDGEIEGRFESLE